MASPILSSNRQFAPDAAIDANASTIAAADLGNLSTAPGAPSGTVADVFTYPGVILKTASLVVVAFLVAFPGYLYPNSLFAFGAMIGAAVIGLVLAFMRNTPPILAFLFAVLEGYALGAYSRIIELAYDVPGAALQALLATAVTFGVVLALYASGRVRYTPKMQKFLLIGMVSYALFSLVNILIMVFGGTEYGWGLRSDVTIMGIPLGILIGVFAVILACVSLIADFDFVENAVKSRQPAKLEWKAAFGITLTIVWLYLEFLRIIAIFGGRR